MRVKVDLEFFGEKTRVTTFPVTATFHLPSQEELIIFSDDDGEYHMISTASTFFLEYVL